VPVIHSEDLSDTMINIAQITILTTNRCNAFCKHCVMHAGPSKNDTLSADQMVDAISQVRKNNDLMMVVFAGGEPLLLGDALLEAIAYADMSGIGTRIVTNAYWAETPAKARDTLQALRESGLLEVNISIDDYHLPFVPMSCVENAWEAAKEMGFLSIVLANGRARFSKITPEFLRKKFGNDLPMRYDDEGKTIDWSELRQTGKPLLAVSNVRVQHLGRACEYVPREDLVAQCLPDTMTGGCPWLIQSAAISFRNSLWLCCGIEATGVPVIDRGDITTLPIDRLLHDAGDDVLVNAMAFLGPQYLRDFVYQRAPALVPDRTQLSGCEICHRYLKEPEFMSVLKNNIHEIAAATLPLRQTYKTSERKMAYA
jgi:hypothetical protein